MIAPIKVLWVEDELDTAISFSAFAEMQGVQLEVASNWERAEQLLRLHFREYSAIILDANCKLKESDTIGKPNFLGLASVRLARIFGEKHELIPWYVLSAGTMTDFDTILELIYSDERRSLDAHWGRMLYRKDIAQEAQILIDQIKQVAECKAINKVLSRHAEVFKYLDNGELSIAYPQARSYMLKMLSVLYNPEENRNFEYESNPLRKVLECLFHTAHRLGLLPDACFDRRGHINLLDASRFLSGMNTEFRGQGNSICLRYGTAGEEKDGRGGDAVFPPQTADFVRALLNYSNAGSHADGDAPYYVDEHQRELFLACVLLLAHVITVFGRFIEEHPDKEQNEAMCHLVETQTISTEQESNTPAHCNCVKDSKVECEEEFNPEESSKSIYEL